VHADPGIHSKKSKNNSPRRNSFRKNIVDGMALEKEKQEIVFFMLSGASLSYTAKENFSLAKYYKKRFLRILIPFYILYIVCRIRQLSLLYHRP